jgi:S1/P1 nuclease
VFHLDRKTAVNLHSVWDTSLLRTYIGSTRIADYADQLDATLTSAQAGAWSGGTPADWANESHVVAREHVYKGVPPNGPPPKLDREYVTANRPVVEQQSIKGGLRLARVLNEALAGTVTPAPAATTAPLATASPLPMPAANGGISPRPPARRWAVVLACAGVLIVLAVAILVIAGRGAE